MKLVNHLLGVRGLRPQQCIMHVVAALFTLLASVLAFAPGSIRAALLAHPALLTLALGLFALGCLSPVLVRLFRSPRSADLLSADPPPLPRRPRVPEPHAPFARGFLRGGRFSRTPRESIRADLYALTARASRAGDEPAACLLERVALLLGSRLDLGDANDFLLGLVDREAPPVRPSTPTEEPTAAKPASLAYDPALESPVLSPAGQLLGYLSKSGVHPSATSLSVCVPPRSVLGEPVNLDPWLTVTLRRREERWETAFPTSTLSRALPTVFRAVVALLFVLCAFSAALSASVFPLGSDTLPGQSASASSDSSRSVRTYHPLPLAWVAAQLPGSASVPTHIRLEGEIAYMRRETDGDVHLRVCHNSRCIVAECIPNLILGDKPHSQGPIGQEACTALRLGQRIAIYGISRYDGAPGHGEHAEGGQNAGAGGGHWEIHPVEGIEVLP